MEQSTRRVINLSDLPTRKTVVEEPITPELRESMLAKSRRNQEQANSVYVDATVAVPVHVDAYVSCDVPSVDC